MSVTDNIDSGMKHLMDWISISATITTLLGWLTPLGALLPIIWYSIPANTNSGSFGPISISSGATITIPASSTWTVV